MNTLQVSDIDIEITVPHGRTLETVSNGMRNIEEGSFLVTKGIETLGLEGFAISKVLAHLMPNVCNMRPRFNGIDWVEVLFDVAHQNQMVLILSVDPTQFDFWSELGWDVTPSRYMYVVADNSNLRHEMIRARGYVCSDAPELGADPADVKEYAAMRFG